MVSGKKLILFVGAPVLVIVIESSPSRRWMSLPAESSTDRGYHSRLAVEEDRRRPRRKKSRISEPKQVVLLRSRRCSCSCRAVTHTRTIWLCRSGVAREAFKLRRREASSAPLPTTSIAAVCVRTWLRGRENVHKRYLLHVAGHNLSLLMRQLMAPAPRRRPLAGGIGALFVLVTPAGAVDVQIVLIVSEDGETAFAAICFAVAKPGQ